ncbi:uncharacterized protein LOC116849463 [Odontomachus brunneus]|uniref:uncharacterized protein LOC116849463 n=1 Tax=Odontomachus brunneus TaxID=486640 RepID=UPI0013F25BC1|nr:uncharacterized protein LOC116849463 [Odontomachus brunneus]
MIQQCSDMIKNMIQLRTELRKDLADCGNTTATEVEDHKMRPPRQRRVIRGGIPIRDRSTSIDKPSVARKGPRIVSDIQLVPPHTSMDATPELQQPLLPKSTWSEVVKRGRKQAVVKVDGNKTSEQKKVPEGAITRSSFRKRVPRNSDITISSQNLNMPTHVLLKKVRDNISLQEIGIERTKIRKTANGSTLVTVLGPDAASKADALAVKVRELVQNDARVTRPIKRANIKLVGIDDSINKEEIACTIAEVGQLKLDDIRIGDLQLMRNGMGIAWVNIPLSAAIKISKWVV